MQNAAKNGFADEDEIDFGDEDGDPTIWKNTDAGRRQEKILSLAIFLAALYQVRRKQAAIETDRSEERAERRHRELVAADEIYQKAFAELISLIGDQSEREREDTALFVQRRVIEQACTAVMGSRPFTMGVLHYLAPADVREEMKGEARAFINAWHFLLERSPEKLFAAFAAAYPDESEQKKKFAVSERNFKILRELLWEFREDGVRELYDALAL